MGLYQMLKGAHYLSHTTTTMLLAWIVVLLWRRALRMPPAMTEAAEFGK
jgi:membrane-associated PAP2 superfamily phosphatase